MPVQGLIHRLMRSTTLAVSVFHKEWHGTPLLTPEKWARWSSRRGRYELNWGFYQLDQYDETIHKWAEQYKYNHDLYRDIRTVFGCGRRIVEFHATHLWGGTLDPEAGNGVLVPSALPISQLNDEAVQQGIARLWSDSDWDTKKDLVCRFGSAMGDVGVEIVENYEAEEVHLRPVHPGSIQEVTRDSKGQITGYTIVESRPDPEQEEVRSNSFDDSQWYTTYTKTCTVQNGQATFFTYRNHNEYDWGEGPSGQSSWTRPYDFAPLVLIQHIDKGLRWGGAEIDGARLKIQEADDLGSVLGDQIRKLLHSPWMFSGVDKIDIEVHGQKSKIAAFRAPKDAKAMPLVSDMPLDSVSNHIAQIRGDLELDYPELMVDRARSSGDMSGKSLREAKKPAETKIKSRRAAYDKALVKAHKMALVIGSIAGFEGYTGLPNDMKDDRLSHRIGGRNVFEMDEFDRQEERLGRANVVSAMVQAGFSLEDAQREAGFPEEMIQRSVAERQRQEDLAMQMALLKAANRDGGLPNPGAPTGGDSQGTPTPEQIPQRATEDRQPVV